MARTADSAELEEEITEQVQEWSANSTEAFEISLWRGNHVEHEMVPEFTYPIFGEDEAIFGYQGLSISLAFAAHNLTPHLSITYDKKFPDQGEVKASDIKGALRDFLPAAAFSEATRESALADAEAAKFTPPGQKIQTFKRNGDTFEIYSARMAEPAAKQIVENMQILVPLYIEGGTILELEHPWLAERWRLFLMYKVHNDSSGDTSRYSLAGYGTSFRNFTFADRKNVELESNSTDSTKENIDQVLARWSDAAKSDETALALPCRERLSQFIILPPYQGQGIGSQLYTTMYAELTKPSKVIEFTVEDPNEAFDDMRDVCDMAYLTANSAEFAGLKVNTAITGDKLRRDDVIPIDEIVDGKAKEVVRKASKIMPRQLARLVEMQTLAKIPRLNRSVSRITRKDKASNENDRAFYFWRLYVKQRLYIQNRDVLVQLDPEDRVDKLEATLESIQSDYERLLAMVEKRRSFVTNGKANGKAAQGASRPSKKRRLEDGDEADTESSAAASASRKKRQSKRVLDEDEEGVDIGDELDA
ncbi:hypothetical protein MBLNU457_6568t1 [Dothideomycetes sp. NU457]